MIIALATAFWLGILTSISPCPLATNIAAISYLAKKINHPKLVLSSSIAYTLGRMFAYTILGSIIIFSLANIHVIAQFLQKYMNKILGPILLIIGLFLLNIIRLNISGISISSEKQQMFAQSGSKGSFMLGILFAISFCPISAALFFGSLIPIAIKYNFGIVFPFFYGIGTALPVIVFAIGITMGVSTVSKWFDILKGIEKYMRVVTGLIFILVGIYYIYIGLF